MGQSEACNGVVMKGFQKAPLGGSKGHVLSTDRLACRLGNKYYFVLCFAPFMFLAGFNNM